MLQHGPMMWPAGEAIDDRVRLNETYMLTDQRNWVSGLHGGGRLVCNGTSDREAFQAPAEEEGTV